MRSRSRKNVPIRQRILDAKIRQREQVLNNKRLLRDEYRPRLAQTKRELKDRIKEWSRQTKGRFHVQIKCAQEHIREQRRKQKLTGAAQRENIRQQRIKQLKNTRSLYAGK